LGPDGAFGRDLRQFLQEIDIDHDETDTKLNALIAKGDYEGALRLAYENERFEDNPEAVAGRIMRYRTPSAYVLEQMPSKDKVAFGEWLQDNRGYSKRKVLELFEALDASQKK
ncbi:hypothetical protein LCGC14_1811780, partial [marine sediment metagenome]